MRFSEAFLDELAARNDIVDVVSSYVELKRKGTNYFGLCPFHSEKTPSFSVAPDKQMYHCFGCKKGGDVINFIMDIEGLTFPEAVRFLAKRANIPMPEESEGASSAEKLRRRVLELNRTAARWFYGLISKAAKTDLRSSSDFKLLDRKAVLVLLNLPERNTFYRALSAWVGFRTARVEFDVQPRTAGQSSWSTFSLIRYAISSLASFTSAPLYLVILMGFLMFLATLLVGGEALFRYLTGEALEGFTTVILLQLFSGSMADNLTVLQKVGSV